MKEEFDDFQNHSISKFESMLKTNSFLFFDSNEFEEIIIYYLDIVYNLLYYFYYVIRI